MTLPILGGMGGHKLGKNNDRSEQVHNLLTGIIVNCSGVARSVVLGFKTDMDIGFSNNFSLF